MALCGLRLATFALAICSAALLGGCEELRRARQDDRAEAAATPSTTSPAGPTETGPLLSQETPLESGSQSGLTQPEIYRGGGSPLRAEMSQGVTGVGPEDITVNFVNADIREVVNAILGNTLGENYVVDPDVQGTVTLRTARPLPRDAAIGMLEDILAMNGAALVLKGDVYEIVPLAEAISAPAIVRQGGAPVRMGRGFSLHVFPLRYASAATLMDVVEPLAPPGRVLRMDAERNLFILAGTSSEASDFGDLLAVFDVDWMRDKSFGLFPLKHADAENVAEELRRIFAQPEAEAGGVIEFLPIQRLHAVLVITARESYIDDARAWVERLDRGIETDRRQLYVYFVQNGRAEELAETVGEALSARVEKTAVTAPQARLAPGLAPREVTSPEASPAPGDTESGSSATTLSSVYGTGESLRRTHPRASEVFARPDIGIGGGSEDERQSEFRIVADARNNALLVYATSDEYELVAAALEKLDIVPLQVLIEATIAEVTLNDTLKYGLEWFFDVGNSSVTFSNAEVTTSNPQPGNLIFSTVPGFSWLFATSDVRVVLNALTQITDIKVVSSPTLMVLDNEPARLQVGDQVPISVRSSTTVIDPDAPVVNEIEYRDTGVILDIIPRVNSSGLVVLDIIQEVSDVVATTAADVTVTESVSPTISQRRIASTVAVSSGETVALGGLIRDNDTEAVTGIPLLSDIPILGNLFKTTTDSTRRTELLVLLTPRVVRDSTDARSATDELRRKLRRAGDLLNTVQ